MVEFLSHLGWSGGDDRDDGLTLQSGVAATRFSLEDINNSPVSVDNERLVWINRNYYKKKLKDPASLKQFTSELSSYVQAIHRYR